MNYQDPLYFHRKELAKQLLTNLQSGITHAITLFAPRRMGKTQFLINDIKPLAEKMKFNTFYFSFMDNQTGDITETFIQRLNEFLINTTKKIDQLTHNINKIEIFGVSLEKEKKSKQNEIQISELIKKIATNSQNKVLFLFDEVQELAKDPKSDGLIKSLRTGLDINQQQVKVIFTGSSMNGLRVMFNNNKAPFFQFAYSLDFPKLDQRFTDFLADIYYNRTGNNLNKTQLFSIFEEKVKYIPLYMRSIIQDMIIDPNLKLELAVQRRLSTINEHSDYTQKWQQLSELEKLIIQLIHQGITRLYTKQIKQQIANKLGIEQISTSQIQGKLRKLERAEWITKGINNSLQLNDSHLKAWLDKQTDK